MPKGFTQTYCTDYLETFVHVAKLNTSRLGDYTLLTRVSWECLNAVLIVYIDDIIIIGNDLFAIRYIKFHL